MDPATLAFLITGVASLLGFAAAGAARDVAHIASKKDGPLPSEQAAAKRRERLGKSLDPDEKPPGYLRRLFTNAHEERRVKAAGARRADKEWLNQNRDQLDADGYEKEKAKRERRAAKKASRTRLLDAFMNAPKGQRLKAALAARKADTTKPDQEVIAEQDTADEKAKVLPFRQRNDDEKPADDDETSHGDDSRTRMLIADMPDEVVRQLAGRDGDERQAEAQRVLDERERTGTSVGTAPDQTWRIHPDGRIERISHVGDLDPNAITRGFASGQLDENTDEQQNTDVTPTPTNTKEDNPMAVIPEIQNISGAITMAQQLAEHAASVQAKTDASRGQWETAIAEQDEIKAAAENGAATFRDQDLHKAAAVLDRLAEAVSAMQNTYRKHLEADAQLIADADNFNAICTDLGKTLEAQQPLAEHVNSADEVAKETKYYQYS